LIAPLRERKRNPVCWSVYVTAKYGKLGMKDLSSNIFGQYASLQDKGIAYFFASELFDPDKKRFDRVRSLHVAGWGQNDRRNRKWD
jgi:hypothetical protein